MVCCKNLPIFKNKNILFYTDYKRKIIFVNADLKNQSKSNVNDSFEIKQNCNNFTP